MMRGSVCIAALALAVLCLTLISATEAGRTHELFAQSIYADGTTKPTTVKDEKAASMVADPLKDVENKLPEKATSPTTVSAQSTLSEPQEADVNSDIGAIHDPESARAQSSMNTPQEQEQSQQHYRDYMGSTPVQGDFRPDARPWWFNPEYDNYGNYVQGRNTQLDGQQPDPSFPSIPNIPSVPNMPMRYPRGYPAQLMGSQFYYSQNSHPASNVQYSAMAQQQQHQYSQNGFPRYTGHIPYEMTSGGCPTQYWISNTYRWPAFFTVKTTVGDALGTTASKVFGQTTLLQALLNTRPDGYSTLLRSASTAILNSYSRSQFKFSHVDVIESFAKALSSSKTAAEQAAEYEEANVSAYTERYNSCF